MKEKYRLSEQIIFYAGILAFLVMPLYCMGWPTSPGPYAPTPLYFIILFILAGYFVTALNHCKKKLPERFKKFIKRRIAFLSLYTVVAVFLLVLEIGFRISGIADWGGGQGPLQQDWRLRKYELNREGFRGPDIPVVKRKNTVRIMGLGDSFAFGQGVEWKDTYLEQLRIILLKARTDVRIETINSAKPGWNTIQQYNYFITEGKQYDPDIIIILFVLNDPEFNGYVLQPLSRIPRVEYVLWRSHLYFYLVRVYNAVFNSYDDYVARLYAEGSETARYCRNAVQEFGNVCRQEKIAPILLICPMLTDFENYRFTGIHEQVSSWAGSAGFKVIDLLPYFRGSGSSADDLRVSLQDWHPNARGHSIIANAVKDAILFFAPRALGRR